jgi:integrase
MKPLGLGEHGGLTILREGRAFVAYLRYRDYSGRGRRIKRSGRSRAEASREVLKAVEQALGADGDDEFTARSTLNEAAKGWLAMFAGQVERGARSPSTYDAYRDVIRRVIEPGVGSLRLGEVTTPRLDRFVQAVLVDRGYATAKLTRSVLSGVCGWLVRRGALPSNPVRDLTPLELDRDRTARALSLEEARQWLRVLDADPAAQHHDLPELARFMLATGLRLGEALGVTWADLDLITGTVAVHRTIIRVQGKGLIAKRVKSKASERGLIMPAWCVEMLRERRVRSHDCRSTGTFPDLDDAGRLPRSPRGQRRKRGGAGGLQPGIGHGWPSRGRRMSRIRPRTRPRSSRTGTQTARRNVLRLGLMVRREGIEPPTR